MGNTPSKQSFQVNKVFQVNKLCLLEKLCLLDSGPYIVGHITFLILRMGNTPDAGSDNIGFRCAKSISKSDANTLTQKVKQEL